ncbi:unnamed protein product [Mytilus coruscus]|uniref:Peptidase A2 domain-containing protein n=1 Tax=Mytilus coruscus TaxID=42192 RepID=A0A6J8CL68_MYTCO|nr:unnamed protein product [Mytilus coruscus]
MFEEIQSQQASIGDQEGPPLNDTRDCIYPRTTPKVRRKLTFQPEIPNGTILSTEVVQENSIRTFLDACGESEDFRMAIRRTKPKTLQEAVTSAMQEECIRINERNSSKLVRRNVYEVEEERKIRGDDKFTKNSKRNQNSSIRGQQRRTYNPCNYCGKTNHTVDKCWKKENDTSIQKTKSTDSNNTVRRSQGTNQQLNGIGRSNNGKDESDIGSNDVAFFTRVNGKPGMVVDGQLEGSPISWKIDTGAGRTFITEESYRNILPDNRPLLRQMKTKFETANGSCLNVLGTAVMTLSFEFCVDFPIIVGGVKLNLLGEDFIKCFRCHWDWNTSSLEINGKNIPF